MGLPHADGLRFKHLSAQQDFAIVLHRGRLPQEPPLRLSMAADGVEILDIPNLDHTLVTIKGVFSRYKALWGI